MKTVCVYHSVDLDGWMSAAIVKYWFEKTYNSSAIFVYQDNIVGYDGNKDFMLMLGYTYGDSIPDLSGFDRVIMCDISFPRVEMHNLASKKELIWIDHHISAITEIIAFDKQCYEEKYKGLRDTKFAACELTWKYFFPNEPISEIVRLLGLYDSFRHKGTDEEQKVLEFQYGARQCISNYEDAYNKLVESLEDDNLSEEYSVVNEIWSQGASIYQYLCTEAKQTYKNGFEIRFTDPTPIPINQDHRLYKFICINKERFNPINFGIDYHKEGYDGAACFHYSNDKWNFSLYNDNGMVDCSVIAKQLEGGGHKGAAGFVCNNETMLKIINNQ